MAKQGWFWIRLCACPVVLTLLSVLPCVAFTVIGPTNETFVNGTSARINCTVQNIGSELASWGVVGDAESIFELDSSGWAYGSNYVAEKHSTWTVDVQGEQYDLVIPVFTIDDEGLYDCGPISEDPGTNIDHYGLQLAAVLVNKLKVYINGSEDAESIVLEVNTQYSIVCEAYDARPAANLIIFKAGEALEGVEVVENMADGFSNTILYVRVVAQKNDNQAKIWCAASQSSGKFNERADLNVSITVQDVESSAGQGLSPGEWVAIAFVILALIVILILILYCILTMVPRPTSVTLTEITNKSVQAQWQYEYEPPEGIVFMVNVSNGKTREKTETSICEATINNLLPSMPYTVTVYAKRKKRTSCPSKAVKFTTKG